MSEDRFIIDIPLAGELQDRLNDIAEAEGRGLESVVTGVIALFILQRTLEDAGKERGR